jgi:hypothetical protein
MRGGGFRSCWSGLEQLESRALPSTVTSVQMFHFDVQDDRQGAVDAGVSVADAPEGRVMSTHSADGDKDDQSGVAKTGSDVSSTSSARTDSATGGGRPSRSQTTAPRDITPDPLVVSMRRPEEPGEDALDGDPLPSGQDTMSSQGGGNVADPTEAVSLVSWSSGVAMPLLMSNAISPGLLVGPDGRLKVSVVDSTPLGAGGGVASELKPTEPASPDPRTGVDVHGDDLLLVDGARVASNRDASTLTGLMEGALHADWDLVDRELRQFLSGLGSLAGDTDGHGTGQLWPLGIGVAAALVVARRAALRRRGLFSSPVHGVLRVSARHAVPSGPWPLGIR